MSLALLGELVIFLAVRSALYLSTKQSSQDEEASSSDNVADIGILVKEKSHSAIGRLSSEKKYWILKNLFRPDADFKFPKKFLDGCNRSCPGA